jgi:phosphoribosylanthranilate isomerase
MAPDIKICGLSTPETFRAALDGGASHVGFIFFPPSPRHVAPREAAALRPAAGGRAAVVAVTVDAADALLDEIVATVQPDMLQMHGRETPERVAEAKRRWGLPVIKALSVREPGDLAAVEAYEGVADRFLFDAKPPQDAALPGGNGVSFDWRLLSGFRSSTPWFLSGGLHAGNVAEALGATRPPGVDISSGVETAPGRKDVGLIDAFLAAVRAAAMPRAAA